MSHLLDASVWLAAVDRDDDFHAAAARLLRARRIEPAALDLTVYEVANVAVRRWGDTGRARRLCLAVLTASGARLVRVDAELAEESAAIADSEQITVYDAAYVAAARRHGFVLVSGDLKGLVRPGLAVSPDAVDP